MWEYLTNYEVEMTLVRGYLRCTHQIVVSYWCCWATEWERTTKHSVLCWDKRAHWQQRLKTWNVVVAHAVTMTTNKIPTTRPRNATVSTFYHMRNHSVATSHIFYMYYASSFNSAFRHSSFRIVESSYCFCSALVLLLSSLFRFFLSLSYLSCRTGNRGSGSEYDTVCLCVGRFIFWHLSWVAFFRSCTLYSTCLPCWFPIATSMRIIFVVYFYLLSLIRVTLFTYNSIIAIRMIILIVRIESAMNDLNKMEQWV